MLWHNMLKLTVFKLKLCLKALCLIHRIFRPYLDHESARIMGNQWKETPKNSLEEEHLKCRSAEGCVAPAQQGTVILDEGLSMLGCTQI